MNAPTANRSGARALAAAALVAAALYAPPTAAQTTFEAGSLIVPMDTTWQDQGMLQAFGLVYSLLRADVPVSWVIAPGKAKGDADLVASATDWQTGAVIIDHGYRGGPFVVAAADAGAAAPIVDAWQGGHLTTVHVATAPFQGSVRRALIAAPSIAVFADGNEHIAFSYLNAAGIPDSSGKAWPLKKLGSYAAWPDVMNVAQVAGPTTTNHADGALFDGAGNPLYCQLMTMHWGVKDAVDEVVAEMRSFLSHPTHLFCECQAVNAIENNPFGHFLTPNGYVIDEAPSKVQHLHDDYAFAQMDGTFGVVGGSEPSYSLPQGDSYLDDDVVMISEAGTPIGTRDVWMTGYIDGACSMTSTVVVVGPGAAPGDLPPPPPPCSTTKGKVSYLGGHKYDVALPISKNPKTQGTRLFLNSLFEADCAVAEGQPNVSLVLSGPAWTMAPEIVLTLHAVNYGPLPLLQAEAVVTLPDGVEPVALGGGEWSAGAHTVSWQLGNVAVGGSATLELAVTLPAPGVWTHQGSVSYMLGVNTKEVPSNELTTVYDVDSDGDGCPDAAEVEAGTLPGDPDTDGDLVGDCEDICPLVPNPLQDLGADPGSCGACGHDCELANATATCENEDCVVATCADGWSDCDGTPATGCEVADASMAGDAANCGGCGIVCTGPNGQGWCVGGECIMACDDGWFDADGVAATGCECKPTADDDATCDGVDDDCDGAVDEDWAGDTCGEGACASAAACVAGVEEPCEPLAPTAEVGGACADGIDNDCDGATDWADPGCPAAGCAADPDCDDGDPCTTDWCTDASGCVHTPAPGCGGGEDAGSGDAAGGDVLDSGDTANGADVGGADGGAETDAGGPGADGGGPGADGAGPGADGAAPGADGAAPGADGAAPGADAAGPGADGAAPGADGAGPGADGAEPGADGAEPGADGAEPGADVGSAGGGVASDAGSDQANNGAIGTPNGWDGLTVGSGPPDDGCSTTSRGGARASLLVLAATLLGLSLRRRRRSDPCERPL